MYNILHWFIYVLILIVNVLYVEHRLYKIDEKGQSGDNNTKKKVKQTHT